MHFHIPARNRRFATAIVRFDQVKDLRDATKPYGIRMTETN